MKKAGRHTDTALLGATIDEKSLPFSQKRLIKDLGEI